MAVSQSASSSSIEELPEEIRSTILSSLPDLHSLAQAALSCRALNSAYKRYESRVIKVLLINYVGPEVLPEADIVLRCCPPYPNSHVAESTPLSIKQANDIIDFNENFLRALERPQLRSMKWTMHEALAMSNLHSVVREFTDRFIRNCSLSSYVQLEKSLHSQAPTPKERSRIMRALYRFELFCRLSSGLDDRIFDCLPAFPSAFTPLEHAQLGCIHDFLAGEVIPAFNDVAKHDIVWAKYRVDFGCDMESPYVQQLLSLGLAELHKIATAQSYADRENILCNGERPSGLRYSFLLMTLRDMNCISNDDDDTSEDEQESPPRSTPFYDDGDNGPQEIMNLHQEQTSIAIYEEMMWPFREWGYVMWDSARLHGLGVFESPLKIAEHHQENPAAVPISEMQKSWDARIDIYRRGGRGWWDENDDSHISWLCKKSTLKSFLSLAQVPASLKEAKRILLRPPWGQ